MKWLKWLIAVGAFLAMLYFTALPGDLAINEGDDGAGLAGTYTVNGLGPTGIEYSGTVVIVAADAPMTYDLQWIVTGAIDAGTGTLSGDTLEVVWESVATSGDPLMGTAEYVVNADNGHLVGTRGVDTIDGVSTEEFFPEG
ncbi:MAG: hypothetical protein R2706_01050 [Acidimicrobiales bacterium]